MFSCSNVLGATFQSTSVVLGFFLFRGIPTINLLFLDLILSGRASHVPRTNLRTVRNMSLMIRRIKEQPLASTVGAALPLQIIPPCCFWSHDHLDQVLVEGMVVGSAILVGFEASDIWSRGVRACFHNTRERHLECVAICRHATQCVLNVVQRDGCWGCTEGERR